MKLYGVESKFNHSKEERTYVYLAENEEDAREQFLMDPNHRKYQSIREIYELEDGICDLHFQLYRDILRKDRTKYRLKDLGKGFGYCGIHDYELLIDNVGDNNETVRFAPYNAHCEDKILQLMVCVDGNVPNWIY